MRNSCLAIALLLLTTSLAHGQGVNGRVAIPDNPGYAERIEIVIERYGEEHKVFQVEHTDSLGRFEFAIPPDTYVFVIKLDGYEELRERVDIRGVAPTYTFYLSRKKPDADDARKQDPNVVDIAELRKTYPRNAVAEYERAQEDERKGNTAKALERVAAALKLAPDFPQAHNYMGMLLEKLKRNAEALKEYEIARQLNPRFAAPLINLAKLNLREADSRPESPETSRQVKVVIDALEEALKLQAGSAEVHYMLGAAYFKAGLDENAELNLKRSSDLNNGQGPARLVLAQLYARQQRWASAFEHVDSYLKANPAAPDRVAVEKFRSNIESQLKK